jgi:hypothetical protein
MQGMLDNLSQPVAFATVPLGNQDPSASASTSAMKEGLRKDNSFSSDTDYEEPMLSRFTRRMGIGPVRDSGKQKATPIDTEGFEDEDLFDEGTSHLFLAENLVHILQEGDHLSESFCLIPSGDEPSPAALKKENTSLRAETAALQKRLKATERMLQMRKEQDVQLRDSIFQATREVCLNPLFALSLTNDAYRRNAPWEHRDCYSGLLSISTLSIVYQLSPYQA